MINLTPWINNRPITAGIVKRPPGDAAPPVPNVITAKQVHGSKAMIVTAKNADTTLSCDALLTNERGVTVGVRTADCLPVLFCDEKATAVAASHAGWRGLAGGILQSTVNQFENAFQIQSSSLHAYVGPSICQSCFETGPEVADIFQQKVDFSIEPFCRAGRDDRRHIDLQGIARQILIGMGLLPTQITRSGECTCCHPETYWSHRQHGGQRGSQLSYIALK